MFLGPLVIVYMLMVWYSAPQKIHVYSDETNDLFQVIQKLEHLEVVRYDSLDQFIRGIGKGEPSLILTDTYPNERLEVPNHIFNLLKEKESRFYVEFMDKLPGVETQPKNKVSEYERAVVNSSFLGIFPIALIFCPLMD